MTKLKVSAAADHLERLTGKSPLVGLNELIWNALDADATHVAVEVSRSVLNAVDRVTVKDDGHGFSGSEVTQLFDSVGGSWKKHAKNGRTRSGERELHGTKGEGRWKALAIGDHVVWRSVSTTDADPTKREEVEVSIRASTSDEVEWNVFGPTTANLGTTVTVYAGGKEPNALLHDKLRGQLCGTFALFLSKYPNVSISLDGNDLDPASLQTHRHTVTLKSGGEHGAATLTIIEWSFNIEKVLCLCDENNATLDQTEVGIRAHDISFTAYVSWHGFRVHEDRLALANLGAPELAAVLEEARVEMRRYFKDRREEHERTTIEGWQDENVYPFKEEPTEPAEQAAQALFNYVAVAAEQTVNAIDNAQAKRLSLADHPSCSRERSSLATAHHPGGLEAPEGKGRRSFKNSSTRRR